MTPDHNVASLIPPLLVHAATENLNEGFMTLSKQNISNDEWSHRSVNALRQANSGNWGLARNEYLEMGKLALEDGSLEQALKILLYVCVLDLNGAQNRGNMPNFTLNEFPSFDPTMAFLAPDVVGALILIAGETRIAMADLQACFFRIASAKFLPVPPEKSWSVLALALQGKIDPNDQSGCLQQIQARINKQMIAMFSRSTSGEVWNWLKSILTIIFPAFIGGGREKSQAARG